MRSPPAHTTVSQINDSLTTPTPDADRIRDFTLAKKAAGAFAQAANTKPELSAFAFHATQYAARPIPTADPDMIAKVAGIEAARGKYICCLDADDLRSECVSVRLHVFEKFELCRGRAYEQNLGAAFE